MLLTPRPHEFASSRRLEEFVALARDLSRMNDAEELINSYRKRARFVVPSDHVLSLSARNVPPGQVLITRSTRWTEPINPWTQRELLPVIATGVLPRLLHAALPVRLGSLDISRDDPAAAYFDGMNSLAASPIYHDGDPLYMVVLLSAEPDAFSEDDLCTLVLTSNLIGRTTTQMVLSDELRAAYAALDHEFRAVGDIQRQLLPRSMPRIPGVRVAAFYEPSRRAGGDYYDFFELPGGRWGVLIADVAGHGTPAAVVMAMLHAFLKAPARDRGRSDTPSAVLSELNAALLDSIRPDQFVTAFVGVIDPSRRRMRFASAGHNPPRLLRAGASDVLELSVPPGLPLGIDADLSCEEAEIELGHGDRLLLYTDGITETFNRDHTMFGSEGLDAALHCCSRSPTSLIDAITTELAAFSDAPAADDRTLIALAFDWDGGGVPLES